MKREFPALAFATLAGDLVSARGVIYGGRVREENSSLFARKAQIASLAADHRALLDEQLTLQTRREEIQQRLSEKTERLEQIREQYQAARGDHSATALQVTTIERELHEAPLAKWMRSNGSERRSSSSCKALRNASRIWKTKRALNARLLEDARQRQTLLQSAAETARLRDEELAEQLSELRLAVATERQRHEGLRSQRQPMTARQAELAELIATRRADIASYQARREQQGTETTTAEHSIEEKNVELSRAESAVTEIAGKRAARLTEVNDLEIRAARPPQSAERSARSARQGRGSPDADCS